MRRFTPMKVFLGRAKKSMGVTYNRAYLLQGVKMFSTQYLSKKFAQHWFYLAAFAIIFGDSFVARSDSWSHPHLLEAALLGDLAIFMPILYFLCYRQQGKRAVIRALALSCSAIWLCTYIIPAEHHRLLDSISWLRYVGMAVLVFIEIRVAVFLFRAVFRQTPPDDNFAAQLHSKTDVPAWLAGFVALEVKFWRAVLGAVKRFFPRK
jgi:dolichol kinase